MSNTDHYLRHLQKFTKYLRKYQKDGNAMKYCIRCANADIELWDATEPGWRDSTWAPYFNWLGIKLEGVNT